MMKVLRYEPALQVRWDDFVRTSKNGTFLFERAFMDYHADRFVDASRIVTDGAGAWVALLPASQSGSDEIASHGGLTYGGFVTDARMGTPRMLEVFSAVGDALRAEGIRRVHYKTVPSIYHRLPAEEDRYALFRTGAALTRRDVLSVLDPRDPPAWQERRTRGAKKARKAGVRARRSDDWEAYWSVLEETLGAQHGAKPVHTVEEISLLAKRFPDKISLHGAYAGEVLVAGVVMFDTGRVAHAQYIAAGLEARNNGALDLLFEHLLREAFCTSPVFDFGISNEQQGRVLNTGLVEQKEGFGGRAVAHDYYRWDLDAAPVGAG